MVLFTTKFVRYAVRAGEGNEAERPDRVCLRFPFSLIINFSFYTSA